MSDLGTLGGANSFGAAINQSGVISGRSLPANGDLHACVWEPRGQGAP